MSHDRSLGLFPIEPPDRAHLTVDEMFEQWWKQYPRRVARGAAKKAFKRVLAQKIASPDQLLAGVMRYAAERVGEDPQYTAHGASWLNAERWLDEPKPQHRRPMSTADSMVVGMMSGMDEHDARALAAQLDAMSMPRRRDTDRE
ncbi:hypothetical protein LJR220_001666 [Bradyrhizobium sp. LjRoot220]|uniref:hypothetical protein n=1 Tax=Bradyrhizobium sp. LjRoot220 TaxID=3342284 RepID=UPI003ECE8ADE